MTPAARPMTVLRLVVVAVSVVAAAVAGWGLLDRAIHAPRYATSGRATIAPDAYVAAARRVLPPGTRIARLTLSHVGGPVIVSAFPATAVYLDPPTARVLDVAPDDPPGGAARPVSPAQSLASVIARAGANGGGTLGSVEWPTVRSPDWTVGVGGEGAMVKVADDSGTARAVPARRPGGAARLASRLGHGARWSVGWQFVVLVGGLAIAVAAWRVGRYNRIDRRAVASPPPA